MKIGEIAPRIKAFLLNKEELYQVKVVVAETLKNQTFSPPIIRKCSTLTTERPALEPRGVYGWRFVE